MSKKFLEALLTGLGFSISFFFIWYLSAYLFPSVPNHGRDFSAIQSVPTTSDGDAGPGGASLNSGMPFYQLSLDEQIKKSTAIVLVTYKSISDGKMSAVISEFLKKDADAQISYEIGDEFPPASFYPSGNKDRGTGAVVFLTGTPAYMRMSLSISENRIAGLGGMPVEALREKCKSQSKGL